MKLMWKCVWVWFSLSLSLSLSKSLLGMEKYREKWNWNNFCITAVMWFFTVLCFTSEACGTTEINQLTSEINRCVIWRGQTWVKCPFTWLITVCSMKGLEVGLHKNAMWRSSLHLIVQMVSQGRPSLCINTDVTPNVQMTWKQRAPWAAH